MNKRKSGTQTHRCMHDQQPLGGTRHRLEVALRRLERGKPKVVENGTKISASAVAKEAGVNRTTLYRFHEPIIAKIERINGRGMKARLKASRAQNQEATTRLMEYRALVEQAQAEVVALARINYQLQARIDELEDSLRVRDERIEALKRQINAVPRSRK